MIKAMWTMADGFNGEIDVLDEDSSVAIDPATAAADDEDSRTTQDGGIKTCICTAFIRNTANQVIKEDEISCKSYRDIVFPFVFKSLDVPFDYQRLRNLWSSSP
jgi:hypothetical protein